MDLFTTFFTLVFIAFGVSVIYLTVVQELHKKSKGISIEYNSVQEIEKILKEKLDCSFVKEIKINKEENIEFKCKYYNHTGTIKEGRFYVDEKARKFFSHRKIEESYYLQKYIEGIFYPEKEEDKEKLELKFNKYIKIFNIARIIKYILYLCAAIYVFLKIGGMDALKSKGVSQMYFTDYSEEITIGEALKTTCSNGKWSSNKIGDSLYYVTFSGYGADGSLLTILFQTDGSECSIKSVVLGGEDITLLQGFLLETIYENAMNGNNNEKENGLSKLSERNTEDDILELNKTDTIIDLEESTTETDESDVHYQSDESIDYYEAYVSIIEDVYISYDEYCEYTLYDLDGDGIKELITSQGTCDADWSNTVYTIEDGYVSMIGEFYGSVMLYVAEDGNGLYAVSGNMGYQYIDQIIKNGSQLQVDTIMNGDIGEADYYSNDKPVNFINITDDSLLRQ